MHKKQSKVQLRNGVYCFQQLEHRLAFQKVQNRLPLQVNLTLMMRVGVFLTLTQKIKKKL